MNSEMAGKITSEVKGLSDVTAATAKELNATRRGIPLHSVMFSDCNKASIGARWPSGIEDISQNDY